MLSCLLFRVHSWAWGGGTAHGKVADIVEEGKAEVTSNKVGPLLVLLGCIPNNIQGNTVSRNAKDGDPAVKISGNKAWACFIVRG